MNVTPAIEELEDGSDYEKVLTLAVQRYRPVCDRQPSLVQPAA